METTRVHPRGSKNTSVLGKIYSECKIFSSIIFILDKLESDGYFERINECLQFIFNKEMAFAVFELKKIKSRKKKFDIKNQLVNNTFIFKENLKIITGSLIDTLWNEKVRTEKIQQTIQKAQQEINKGTFEEIIELEDEENYFSSEVISKKEAAPEPQAMPPVVEEEFMHSYETELESREFKFASGGASPKKGAGEDQSKDAHHLESGKPASKEREQVVQVESERKDAREFGTFGDKMPEKESRPKGVSQMKKKSHTGKNWRTGFEVPAKDEDGRGSIDKEIKRMRSKDMVTCQSMGNKWDLKPWEKPSSVEKPRTSASMGSLTIKSSQNPNCSEKEEHPRQLDLEPKKKQKSNWKPASGLNMYLLSRKNGSSQGSSMRSVSKSGSLLLENSTGAKSESLKRKRENRGWAPLDQTSKENSKRTLADRLSGQKHRNLKGAFKGQMKKFPTYVPKKQGVSMTPDISTNNKKNFRVNSMTKLKRLKNHLKLGKNALFLEESGDGGGPHRGRVASNRSPQQMVKRIISGFDKDSRIKKKGSAKVPLLEFIIFSNTLSVSNAYITRIANK